MEDHENLLTKLFFGKYKIIHLIAKGSFGEVYLGYNILNNQLYALKIENKFCLNPLLQTEAYILYNVRGPGIPSVITFGHSGAYNILVESLLGKSLEKVWIENNKKLNLKDISMIAIQTLERIEYIHSKDYIHRDIKPANFLVGYPDTSLIYIIDFGNARKYRSSRTGKHIQSFKINRIFGTTLFLSLNVLRGNEQSRKDDLESLGYMYIFLATGELPWSKIKVNSLEQMLDKTCELKENTSIEILCKNMPNEMILYMKYVRNLTFNEEPDYNYLRSLFQNILINIGQKNDNIFSWVDQSQINKVPNKKSSKSNPQSRLLKKIIESNKTKRNLIKDFNQVTNTDINKEEYKKINIRKINDKDKFTLDNSNIRNDLYIKNNISTNIVTDNDNEKKKYINNINPNYDKNELKLINENIKKKIVKKNHIHKKTPNINNNNNNNTLKNPTIIININKNDEISNFNKSKYLSNVGINMNKKGINNIFNNLIDDINYKKKTNDNNGKNSMLLNDLELKKFSIIKKKKINKTQNNNNISPFSTIYKNNEIKNINYKRRFQVNGDNNYLKNNIVKKHHSESIKKNTKYKIIKNKNQSNNYFNLNNNKIKQRNSGCSFFNEKALSKKERLNDIKLFFKEKNVNENYDEKNLKNLKKLKNPFKNPFKNSFKNSKTVVLENTENNYNFYKNYTLKHNPKIKYEI